jgi:hypothetical protein
MAIPHVYGTVYPQDFTLTPVKVHKKFLLQRSQLYSGSTPQTGSGYKLLDARYPMGKLKLGTDYQKIYETNSFDGSYKSLVWKSIDSQYYRFPYDRYKTLEHANPRFTYKNLGISASIISIPYLDYGESIKPGSVELTASGRYFNDDGNGNLYDRSIDTGSYPSNDNLVAYWGFNDVFRSFKNGFINKIIEKGEIAYKSYVFEPDVKSVVRQVYFSKGFPINLTSSNFSAEFLNGNGAENKVASIWTPNRPEFNFAGNSDFSITFFYRANVYNNIDTIISKNTIVTRQIYGNLPKYNQNDLIIDTLHVSSSIDYLPTNVYPYKFYFDGVLQKVFFKRSDGINTFSLSMPYLGGDFYHVGVVKSGSMITMYKNGLPVISGSDNTNDPINNHDLVFGNESIYSDVNGMWGNIDEIRFYDKGLTPDQMATLAKTTDQSAYQTAVCGNVFYKSGNIVITGHDPIYNVLLNSEWTLKFRSTHVIYSYECLIRIPAGSFNLSQNPSTLKNAYTDLIIDEMTGSLAEGALFPYVTAIGLYNEKRELVAVGKLSQPLQMRDDVNINISVKWDA